MINQRCLVIPVREYESMERELKALRKIKMLYDVMMDSKTMELYKLFCDELLKKHDALLHDIDVGCKTPLTDN